MSIVVFGYNWDRPPWPNAGENSHRSGSVEVVDKSTADLGSNASGSKSEPWVGSRVACSLNAVREPRTSKPLKAEEILVDVCPRALGKRHGKSFILIPLGTIIVGWAHMFLYFLPHRHTMIRVHCPVLGCIVGPQI